MQNSNVSTIAVLVSAIFLHGCGAPDGDDASPFSSCNTPLCWAEDLVENVSPEFNEYAGEPTIMRWAGVDTSIRYQNRSRTAGFVSGVFARAGVFHSADFGGSYAPFASDFCTDNAIEVENIYDIIAGDIVAIRFLQPVVEYDSKGDLWEIGGTGQVAIVREPVKAISGGVPCDALGADMAGTKEFALNVVDSAQLPHGPMDTRAPDHAGAGFGAIRVFADNNARIVGYSWSPAHATCHEPSKQKLIVCRYPL